MQDAEQQPEFKTRAGVIIEELKESHSRQGKFGLLTLFVVLTVLAAVLAILKATVGFEIVFDLALIVLFLLYGFAPLFCWSVVTLRLAFLQPRNRIQLACASVAIVSVTFWTVTFYSDPFGLYELLAIIVATVLFWAPQIICIAAVRYLLFRETPGSRSD